MMFGHFYNSSIRRYIVLMLELFNHIEVSRKSESGEIRLIKVPITYGSKEKFVAVLNKINMPTSEKNIAKVETILPRINLNLIDMQYNGQFKTNITNRRTKTKDNGQLIEQFNPVPYRFSFELGIFTRHEDDMFQIVEQILPYFQPHFSCTLSELYDNEIIIKDRDVNITIQGITPDEQVEGDMLTRRRLEWTIMFDFNGWLYPNTKYLRGQIRTVYLDFFANRKELGDGEEFTEADFESADLQVVPKQVKEEAWEGEHLTVYTDNTPKEDPPRPQP